MRHTASNGSLAMAKAAQPNMTEAEQINIQQGLLRHYAQINGQHSHLFEGSRPCLIIWMHNPSLMVL